MCVCVSVCECACAPSFRRIEVLNRLWCLFELCVWCAAPVSNCCERRHPWKPIFKWLIIIRCLLKAQRSFTHSKWRILSIYRSFNSNSAGPHTSNSLQTLSKETCYRNQLVGYQKAREMVFINSSWLWPRVFQTHQDGRKWFIDIDKQLILWIIPKLMNETHNSGRWRSGCIVTLSSFNVSKGSFLLPVEGNRAEFSQFRSWTEWTQWMNFYLRLPEQEQWRMCKMPLCSPGEMGSIKRSHRPNYIQRLQKKQRKRKWKK